MDDIYAKNFMLNIGPMGISLVGVREIDQNLSKYDSFNIDVNFKQFINAPLHNFSKYLMGRVSREIGDKVMEGHIQNGDFLKLLPTMDGPQSVIQVSIYRSGITYEFNAEHIKKLTKNLPNLVAEKKREIDFLRNRLNEALESENYLLCENLIQKIDYLKKEFMM